MKVKSIIVTALVLALGVALLASLDDSSFGPVDTYPRLYKTARCPDPGWASVAVYRKKHRWFSPDTDIWVKVFDGSGKVVHEERVFQVDLWDDAAGYLSGNAPSGFCNKALITKKAI